MSNTPTFLGREPVLWVSAARAALYVAVLFGLPLTDAQTAGILLAVEAILALVVRASVVPNPDVVEYAYDERVLAGPANELVDTGETVRPLRPGRHRA